MSQKGGQNGVKDGGAHEGIDESSPGSEEIDSSNLLDAQFLPKSINSSTPVSSICLQNGGVETHEEPLALLSSDSDDLESFERAVIDNNTEWLKARCRSLEGVDFGIPTSSHDMLDLEVKDKDMGGELFEEMETISGDDGDTVISICGTTGRLSTSTLNDVQESVVHITPIDKQSMGDSVAINSLDTDMTEDENNSDSDSKHNHQNTILLSAQELESLQGQGFVLDSLNVDGDFITTAIKLATTRDEEPETGSSSSANLSVITESSDSETSMLNSKTEQKKTEIELTKKLNVLDPSQILIPSSTGTYVVAQSNSNQPNADNPTQPNLTLATISISTDKVANSTQILVNTNQGQQLYLINTADLTQATNALQPLAQPPETSVLNPVLSPVAPVVAPPPQSPVMSIQPLQVQGKGILLLPVNSETDAGQAGMVPVLTLPSSSTSSSDRSPSKRIWVCQEDGCGKVFRKLSKLKIHQMRHTGERPFKCSKPGCDWAFTTAYKLKRHEEAHDGRKDYICDVEGCGRKFTTVYNLNSHKKLHERPYTEICPKETCQEQFTSKRQLDMHMRTHSGLEKNYKCPHNGCNKVFFSRNSMGSHARVHLIDEEDLKCKFDGCGKVFDKLCRLKQHQRLHTGEKPYVCLAEGCNWAFATASKLKRHSAKHTGVRKWTCSICLKGFMRAEHLKGHMVTHSGDKPFVCPVENCMAKFTAKGSLYVHVKKHEAQNDKITYHCPIEGCLSHYTSKVNLRQHILKHYVDTSSSMLDLVPLLAGYDMSDTILDSLITTTTETATPTSISVSSPSLSNTAATGSNKVTSSTVEFINPILLTDPVSVSTTTESPNSEVKTIKTTVTTKSPNVEYLPTVVRVALENTSGSARTDYRSNHILSDRARKRWHSLKGGNIEENDINNLQKEANDKINSLVLPDLSTDFNSTDISNSQGLMFRDPETGITYVQTQLLQDDPPHPEIYSESLLESSDISSTSNTNITAIKSEFSGTTINLQDLE